MRRALTLIISLTLLTIGCSLWADRVQQDTALDYLQQLNAVRRQVLAGDLTAAAKEQAYMHALWQHDAKWLNCLIDHHHTRSVDSALTAIGTALEQNEPFEALQAIDEADSALDEIACSEQPLWETIL